MIFKTTCYAGVSGLLAYFAWAVWRHFMVLLCIYIWILVTFFFSCLGCNSIFPLKHQECFVNWKTSLTLPSVWVWLDNDWILIFGWTVSLRMLLACLSLTCLKHRHFHHIHLTLMFSCNAFSQYVLTSDCTQFIWDPYFYKKFFLCLHSSLHHRKLADSVPAAIACRKWQVLCKSSLTLLHSCRVLVQQPRTLPYQSN